MPESALAIGNMMLAAYALGIGSCWLNQLPGLTARYKMNESADTWLRKC